MGAMQAFRKELAANPNDFDANFQLASILAHRGKTAEARPLLERAVAGPAGFARKPATPWRTGSARTSRQPDDPGIAVGLPGAAHRHAWI